LKEYRYILFNKPYGVLCQFTDREGRATLSDFGPFPRDVYPAGRLDRDSEGLLLLTNDGSLKHLLLEPRYEHARTYLVQVERIPTDEAMERLRHGVLIESRRTRPAEVRLLTRAPEIPDRGVPVRYRKNVPTSWMEITLREGKNRQIRKMTAAVGFPTLRLVRVGIGRLVLGSLQPGEWKNIPQEEIRKLTDHRT